jgi:hypothetical protein
MTANQSISMSIVIFSLKCQLKCQAQLSKRPPKCKEELQVWGFFFFFLVLGARYLLQVSRGREDMAR